MGELISPTRWSGLFGNLQVDADHLCARKRSASCSRGLISSPCSANAALARVCQGLQHARPLCRFQTDWIAVLAVAHKFSHTTNPPPHHGRHAHSRISPQRLQPRWEVLPSHRRDTR